MCVPSIYIYTCQPPSSRYIKFLRTHATHYKAHTHSAHPSVRSFSPIFKIYSPHGWTPVLSEHLQSKTARPPHQRSHVFDTTFRPTMASVCAIWSTQLLKSVLAMCFDVECVCVVRGGCLPVRVYGKRTKHPFLVASFSSRNSIWSLEYLLLYVRSTLYARHSNITSDEARFVYKMYASISLYGPCVFFFSAFHRRLCCFC